MGLRISPGDTPDQRFLSPAGQHPTPAKFPPPPPPGAASSAPAPPSPPAAAGDGSASQVSCYHNASSWRPLPDPTLQNSADPASAVLQGRPSILKPPSNPKTSSGRRTPSLPKTHASPPDMEKAEKLPPWMGPLMWSSFFDRCSSHSQWYGRTPGRAIRSGCNILCIDCCIAICSRCTQEEHRGHRTIQIRISSFQNVVKLEDIKPFFDVAQVQTHVINGCRVVCVNKRPKTTARRWPDNGIGGGGSICKEGTELLAVVPSFKDRCGLTSLN